MNKTYSMLLLVALLAACSSTPVVPVKRHVVDQSWTSPARAAAAEAARPVGQLEAWEKRRPVEFSRTEAE